jgi:hypothetical protein
MSSYQKVKVESVDGSTIVLRVQEIHPDMTELGRLVDKHGVMRKSMAKRARNFAALLLTEQNDGDNSFKDQLNFLVDVGVVPALEDAAQKLISGVEVSDMKVIRDGSQGPMHSATVTITARSSLGFRSFRKGKSHLAVACLDGDIYD